jgi:hypothetical protein
LKVFVECIGNECTKTFGLFLPGWIDHAPYEETTVKKKNTFEEPSQIHYSYPEHLWHSALSFPPYRENFLSVALQVNNIKKLNAKFHEVISALESYDSDVRESV